MLSALLRLGNKYDVAHLRDNALYRLRSEYALTYEELRFGGFIYFSEECAAAADAMNFDLVNLAHQEGVFSALPLSLFVVVAHYKTVSKFIR